MSSHENMPSRQFLLAMLLVLSLITLLQGYAFLHSMSRAPRQLVAEVPQREKQVFNEGREFEWKKFTSAKHHFSVEIPPLYGASYEGGTIYGTDKVLASAASADSLELNDWTDCEGGIFFKAAVKKATDKLACDQVQKNKDCTTEDVVIDGHTATKFSCKSYISLDENETSVKSSMHEGLCVKNGDETYELELTMPERTTSPDYKAAIFDPSSNLFAKVVSSFHITQ